MTTPHSRDQAAPQPDPAITGVLHAVTDGEPGAENALANLVYEPLRAIAIRQLQAERAGHTLEPSGLVHLAYVRLVNQPGTDWRNRAHFFAVASRVMRRILVDHARRHQAARRGGGFQMVPLEPGRHDAPATETRADELIALDDALRRLEEVDPRLSRVVECRFFAGLTEDETAETLGVTARTVARDWVKARAWLYRALQPDDA